VAFRPVRLSQLEAHFIKVLDERSHMTEGVSYAEADGVQFLCPVCFQANGGSYGTHSVICWTPKVAADRVPGPGRWTLQGTSLEDLTLVAGSSSVALTGGGCAAHFFIRQGNVVDANP
jgi:hypothetical protein